jgi:hypothetical protein
MKTFTIFVALICSALATTAQLPFNISFGDTLGPWTVISFEEPSNYIHINSTAQNIWQTGTPEKLLFSQAFSVPFAMVTDTLNFYPTNNYSSFDLFIGGFNTNGSYFHDLFIDFRHKFDTDTLHDGMYITVSWDYGQSWMNILDDTVSTNFFFATPARNWGMLGNTSLYTTSDTLFNGEHGFSGRSDGWVHSCMAWYDLPVKQRGIFLPDTMIIRFNFISDNSDHQREGSMIDDVRIFSVDLGSGIKEEMAGSLKVLLIPNPVKSTTTVMLNNTYDQVAYQLTDAAGRTLSLGQQGRCSKFELRRENLSPGIYLLKVSCGTRMSQVRRIVFL